MDSLYSDNSVSCHGDIFMHKVASCSRTQHTLKIDFIEPVTGLNLEFDNEHFICFNSCYIWYMSREDGSQLSVVQNWKAMRTIFKNKMYKSAQNEVEEKKLCLFVSQGYQVLLFWKQDFFQNGALVEIETFRFGRLNPGAAVQCSFHGDVKKCEATDP